MSIEQANLVLGSFGDVIGLAGLCLDEHGYACLAFDDLTVNLEYEPSRDALVAFSWLGDNRQVVLALSDSRLRSRHLWVADTRSDAMRQVTVTHTNETEPAFAAASRLLAYVTEDVDFDLFQMSADGRARAPTLSTARNV